MNKLFIVIFLIVFSTYPSLSQSFKGYKTGVYYKPVDAPNCKHNTSFVTRNIDVLGIVGDLTIVRLHNEIDKIEFTGKTDSYKTASTFFQTFCLNYNLSESNQIQNLDSEEKMMRIYTNNGEEYTIEGSKQNGIHTVKVSINNLGIY